MNLDQFSHYPAPEEVDSWIDSVWKLAENTKCQVQVLEKNGFSHSLGINHAGPEYRFIRFSPSGMNEFYGYWQPSISGPAPLLFHVPGYGAEMSTHPDLVSLGYNVLHISPLGYATPDGPDESKKHTGDWPVLPDTVISGAQKGYKIWLANCIMAAQWARTRKEVLPNRISFFGTSQGGGGSLILGSMFRDRGVRCVAADVPFLTNYPLAAGRGAYRLAVKGLDQVDDKAAAWHALGYVDTISHARRLKVPILLTAGGEDPTCPADTIKSLYDCLPCTKSLSYFKDLAHRYSREFVPLASAWFRMYA